MENAQSRKWLITINNPQKDYSHDVLKELALKCMPDYFCLADEIASTGTYHTHLFLYSKSPIRFKTLKERFKKAHLDKSCGSILDNRNYVGKFDKWADSEKSETKVEGTFEEWGEIPVEKLDTQTELAQVIEEIKSGKEIYKIVQERPRFALNTKKLEELKQTLLMEEERKISTKDVWYIWGATGVGKTRSIYEKYSPKDIFRITNYKNQNALFDGYCNNKVVVFEEFFSQIPINEMLNYLDIYPIYNLPARYNPKQNNYDTIYLTSNISVFEQYRKEQEQFPSIWEAFLRRITNIAEMKKDGTLDFYKKDNVILKNQLGGNNLC